MDRRGASAAAVLGAPSLLPTRMGVSIAAATFNAGGHTRWQPRSIRDCPRQALRGSCAACPAREQACVHMRERVCLCACAWGMHACTVMAV